MSLVVWLPLNGSLENLGASTITPINYNAVINTAGKIGSCYHFGTANSYMILPNTVMNSFTTECSVAFWLKIKTWNTSYATYFQAGLGSTPWSHYIFGFLRNKANSNICFTISNGSTASNASYLTSNLSLDTWYHIALTYKTGKCSIYLNGSLDHEYTTSIVPAFSSISKITLGVGNATGSYQTDCDMNDFRIYNHCLSNAEIKDISLGLILHYKLDGIDTPNENLGGTSANYSNLTHGATLNLSGWGGDTGTVTFYHYGGYAGLPYKVYHKTSAGTGGVYYKTANDINLEANTTYTMSIWMKASREFSDSAYNFNINRGSDNLYINYGSSFVIHTEWTKYTKTFTTSDSLNGAYGEMSIIYNDAVDDYYIYFSGFKIEKGTVATEWTPPGVNYTTILDSSGYNNNGTINSVITLQNNSARYSNSAYFGNYNTPNATLNTPSILSALSNCTITWWEKCTTTGNTLLFTGHTTSHYIAAGSSSIRLYDSNVGTPIIYKDGVVETNHTYSGANNYHGGIFHTQNEWHHFALVGANLSAWSQFKINSYSSSWPLNAYLNDVRIYSTALSADDIKSLYESSGNIDNKQNLNIYEVVETNSNLFAGKLLTSSYSAHVPKDAPLNNINSDGEYYFSANSTSAGSEFITINPQNHTYEYDFTISVNAGNQFYIGFERYDAAKTSRSNNACVYVYATKPTSDVVRLRFTGTVNLSTDGTNPCKYVTLRILNGWSGTNSGVTGTATIHSLSLREIGTKYLQKITKQGQAIEEEIMEVDNARVYKNGIIEVNNLNEF